MTNIKADKRKIWYIGAGLVSAVLLVVLDQVTKVLAQQNLMNQEPFIIIENVFQLRYLENRGAAFGIMQNQKWFFLLSGILILSFIVYAYNRMPLEKKYHIFRVISVLMAAGAVGNMIDRTFRHYVIDFFYFELIDFPIFNVADCFVVVATVLLLLALFMYKEEDFAFLQRKGRNSSGNGHDEI